MQRELARMPTVEEGECGGHRGCWVRAEIRASFALTMREYSVWHEEKQAWFVFEELVRHVEQLILDHWPEFMYIGGRKDGFIVNRLGVVSVQERML